MSRHCRPAACLSPPLPPGTVIPQGLQWGIGDHQPPAPPGAGPVPGPPREPEPRHFRRPFTEEVFEDLMATRARLPLGDQDARIPVWVTVGDNVRPFTDRELRLWYETMPSAWHGSCGGLLLFALHVVAAELLGAPGAEVRFGLGPKTPREVVEAMRAGEMRRLLALCGRAEVRYWPAPNWRVSFVRLVDDRRLYYDESGDLFFVDHPDYNPRRLPDGIGSHPEAATVEP